MKQDQLNAINIYQNIMPDSTCEYLEKAKKANIGTIHIWSNGDRYQKTTNGWVKLTEVRFKDYKLDLKISTERQFCKDGIWDKDRIEKVHKPIIQEFLSKAKHSKEPVVTLMMGAPASGKGTTIELLKDTEIEYKDILVVDPDKIKTQGLSKDYKEYKKYNLKKAASKVHEEGSYISKQIIKELDNIGTHYIQDKCFADYDKLIKEIDRLANLGVKVKIMMTSSSVEKAYQRMLKRGKKTGRYVDEKYFYEQHRKVEKTFSKLLKNLPQNVVLVRQYYNDSELQLIKQIQK